MPGMSEKVEKREEKREEKRRTAMKKINAEPIRIAEIIYGTEELTKCMESIIKVHRNV